MIAFWRVGELLICEDVVALMLAGLALLAGSLFGIVISFLVMSDFCIFFIFFGEPFLIVFFSTLTFISEFLSGEFGLDVYRLRSWMNLSKASNGPYDCCFCTSCELAFSIVAFLDSRTDTFLIFAV